jgi:hypothetical protein
VRTCRGNGCSTEFSDAILKATSAHGHNKQVQFLDKSVQLENITSPMLFPYPECRSQAQKFAVI